MIITILKVQRTPAIGERAFNEIIGMAVKRQHEAKVVGDMLAEEISAERARLPKRSSVLKIAFATLPIDYGRLAKDITADLALAERILEQLRLTPDKSRRFVPESVGYGFDRLLNSELSDVAPWFDSRYRSRRVKMKIVMAAARAASTLRDTSDLDSAETLFTIALLEYARQAAQLAHKGSWKQLAPILVELCATEWLLGELESPPSVPILDPEDIEVQLSAALEKLEKLSAARSRGSKTSAQRRRPEQQRRIQAFIDAIRACPDGGPQLWSTEVSERCFGGSEARHVESAGRWFRRHQKEIDAALMADSSLDRPPESLEQ